MKLKKLGVCLLFSLLSVIGFSQKVYFIYLQTENDQSFYVKMNGKIHSSSAMGYIIISKLYDTTYSITVGFPQNKWPEQSFSVVMNKKDHGYLLKNFGEKGWGLFDLQTLTVQMSISGSAKTGDKKKEENKDVSVFTEILSKAADDPSLKEKSLLVEIAEAKPEKVLQDATTKVNNSELPKDSETIKQIEKVELEVVKKEESKSENPELSVGKVEESIAQAVEEYKPTMVTKRSESSTTEGFGLVFIDLKSNGENDTIRLLIPNPRSIETVIKEEPKEEKKFIDMPPDTIIKKEEKVAEIVPVNIEVPVENASQKTNCSLVAEEADFFKLRKNMASVEGDDNMLIEAKNYFQTKCFTTEQVKNLGLLFLNDKGKFNFFELAYKYVTDTDKFNVLQNELKDENYINRFRALLSN